MNIKSVVQSFVHFSFVDFSCDLIKLGKSCAVKLQCYCECQRFVACKLNILQIVAAQDSPHKLIQLFCNRRCADVIGSHVDSSAVFSACRRSLFFLLQLFAPATTTTRQTASTEIILNSSEKSLVRLSHTKPSD